MDAGRNAYCVDFTAGDLFSTHKGAFPDSDAGAGWWDGLYSWGAGTDGADVGAREAGGDGVCVSGAGVGDAAASRGVCSGAE